MCVSGVEGAACAARPVGMHSPTSSLGALLLLLSFSAAACSANAPDASTPPSDEVNITGDKPAKDDLVACKGVDGNEKGDLRITLIGKDFMGKDTSEKESQDTNVNPKKAKVVAVGFRGSYTDRRGKQSIEYSQGDQPDISSISRTGSTLEFGFLKKECAGHCQNYMTLSQGGGESEEVTFIRLESLVIDTKNNTLVVSGKEDSIIQGNKLTKREFHFKTCGVNKDVVDSIDKGLR